MNGYPLISALTFAPLLGGILLLGMDANRRALARGLAFAFSLLALVLTLWLWMGFSRDSIALQFVERHPWIPTLGIEYFVGVDGLGLVMVLLAAVVTPMAILVSWNIEKKAPLHYALILFLEAGLFGAFTALSFFHWFLFWELSLIPAFFLIKFWGGAGRSQAATQFFVYTMVGSVAMLVAFMGVAFAAKSFDFMRLAEMSRSGELAAALQKLKWAGLNGSQISFLLFAGIFLGFAVKVPLMPFHTWLPSAYAEAPTGTTILLTGAMSKMGVYGFLRVLLPLFPGPMRDASTLLLWLAVITIVCSAGAALAQKDLKRVFAYSSINHLGYCLLGIFAAATTQEGQRAWSLERSAALNGVVLQMFNHGLTALALFCFLSFLERRSGGTRGIDDFGGLRKAAPVFCGLMGISVFASLGLPGLNGFAGEFLIFKGVFSLAGWAAAFSSLGLLVTAVFLLNVMQKVFSGPIPAQQNSFKDLSWGERCVVIPATVLMFVLGLWPQLLVDLVNPSVVGLVSHLHN